MPARSKKASASCNGDLPLPGAGGGSRAGPVGPPQSGAEPAAGQSDEALVKRAQAGDSQAFTLLVNRYIRLVYSVIREMTSDPQSADDLAQEVFLRVFRGLAGFRQEASFKTWLLRIVTNLCLKYRGPLARLRGELWRPAAESDGEGRNSILDEAWPSLDPLPGEVAEDAELKQELRQAVQKLPDHYRSVILLRYYADLSYQEIADTLACPLGTVMSRLHKARLLLARALELPAQPGTGETAKGRGPGKSRGSKPAESPQAPAARDKAANKSPASGV